MFQKRLPSHNTFMVCPIGCPKYFKGRLLSPHPKNSQAISINSLETFIQIKQLFKKFTFRPDAASNPCKIAFNVQRLPTVAFHMQIISSAYCKCDITNPSSP